MALMTEQNTREVEEAICTAFENSLHYLNSGPGTSYSAFFEHGHWWVRTIDPSLAIEEEETTYSVVDADGPGSFDGFDFEEI